MGLIFFFLIINYEFVRKIILQKKSFVSDSEHYLYNEIINLWLKLDKHAADVGDEWDWMNKAGCDDLFD